LNSKIWCSVLFRHTFSVYHFVEHFQCTISSYIFIIPFRRTFSVNHFIVHFQCTISSYIFNVPFRHTFLMYHSSYIFNVLFRQTLSVYHFVIHFQGTIVSYIFNVPFCLCRTFSVYHLLLLFAALLYFELYFSLCSQIEIRYSKTCKERTNPKEILSPMSDV